MTFIDGNLNVPGCQCTNLCGMPCWQRAGITTDGCEDSSHEPCPPLPDEPEYDEEDPE